VAGKESPTLKSSPWMTVPQLQRYPTSNVFHIEVTYISIYVSIYQWRTEGVVWGGSNLPRNFEDIGGVLDRMSKKNRRLDFVLKFGVFSYGCNLLNKGFF